MVRFPVVEGRSKFISVPQHAFVEILADGKFVKTVIIRIRFCSSRKIYIYSHDPNEK